MKVNYKLEKRGGGNCLKVDSKGFQLSPQKHNYINGFTLAEVLITLGIIGVVAALTIPD